MIGRREFLGLAAAMALPSACSRPEPSDGGGRTGEATSPEKTAPGARLKLSAFHVPNLCLMGSRIAHERGFFRAEGLDVDLLPADLSTAHQHGGPEWVIGPNGPLRPDITTVEYASLVDMALGKYEYYVVAGEHSGCRQLIVPVRSPIKSLADLKGMRIALPTFNDQLMWDYLIRQAGVAPESVQWVPEPVPPGGSAELEFVKREFAAGRLDAYVSTDPAGEMLKRDGVARMLASNTWTVPLSGWYCCMIAVRREVIDTHPEVAGAVTRAYRRAAAFIEEQPAEAVAIAVKAGYMSSDTPQDLCARLLAEYVWTATGRIEEDLERYFQLLIQAGRLPKSSSPAELAKRVYRGAEV